MSYNYFCMSKKLRRWFRFSLRYYLFQVRIWHHNQINL